METINCRLPGDYYQFDPLGLGKDPTFLKWYREAELIHGRRAMATVVGIFVGQACSGIPWLEAGADRAQSPILLRFPHRDLTHPHGVCRLLQPGFTPWSKTAENFANAMGEQGYPRGKFFDPRCLAGTIKDRVYLPDMEKLERLKLDEIKHARIATLAMLIFIL